MLQVTNMIIEHLSIVGCGMKHISTSNHGNNNYISVYSTICIQNCIDIFLMDVNISNSTGIGLLMYHTNGLVHIKRCIFTNNTLSPLHSKANGSDYETSGGGIHTEFTNCPPGVAPCDCNDNHYNNNLKYIINHCIFEGNAVTFGHKNHKKVFPL